MPEWIADIAEACTRIVEIAWPAASFDCRQSKIIIGDAEKGSTFLFSHQPVKAFQHSPYLLYVESLRLANNNETTPFEKYFFREIGCDWQGRQTKMMGYGCLRINSWLACVSRPGNCYRPVGVQGCGI